MNKQTLIAVVVAVMVGVFAMAGVLMAADVPETITIHDPAFGEYKKGPVEFTHGKHVKDHGVACVDCHHKYEDGKNVWKEGDPVQKCSECHPMDKNEGKLYKLKAGTVFHKNCRDCHKEMQKGPYKKCDECHGE